MGKVYHYVVTFEEDTGKWRVFFPDGVDAIPIDFSKGEVFNQETLEWEHVVGEDMADERTIYRYDIGQSNLENLLEDEENEKFLLTQIYDGPRM